MGADIYARLAQAYNDHVAVEVTVRLAGPLPETVGVAELDEHGAWVDLYVTGPYGYESRHRVAIADISHVEVTDLLWWLSP